MTEQQALATRSEVNLLTISDEQKTIIKNTVAKDATDMELAFFLQVAVRRGLDPFARQIHFVKRAGVGTIQVGIDGFRAIAERSGKYNGQDAPIYNVDKDGAPISATVVVYRRDFDKPIGATAFFREFYQDVGPMWKKMPFHMLAKCAEALALRKAFPEDLSGLYSEEETDTMETHAGPTAAELMPRAVGAGPQPAARPTGWDAEGKVQTQPAQQEQPAGNGSKISEGQQKRLFAIAMKQGWTKEDLKMWLQDNWSIEHSKDIEKKDYEQIVDGIEAGGRSKGSQREPGDE